MTLTWFRKHLWLFISIFVLFSALPLEAQTSTLPQFGHVFIVVEENTNYSSVVGSSNMPYLNSLINQYGLATNYYATTHPSIGNYFSLTTGEILTNNDNETPSSFPVSADNIVRELIKAGKTWKDYAESLPSVGYLGGNSGNYVVHHNPIAYFTDVNCGTSACLVEAQNIVPFTQFAVDLASGALPQYSFIVPNVCDDAHNCSLSTADNWLKANLAPLLSSPTFQKDGLLIILFDENASTGTSCSTTGTVSSNCGGQVAEVMVSPLLKSAGLQVSTFYNHFSTLRTMAQGLGLTTFPDVSSSATAQSDFFGTASTSNTPVASLSPTSLSFGSVDVGTTSAAQTVKLTNTGNATLSISGISANGSFTETNNCGSSLAASASCSISVSFSPQTTGTLSGTLSVSDNAAGSPQSVSLSGSGVTSSTGSGGVTLTPTSLNFGTVQKGTSSPAQAVILHNGTSSVLGIYSVWIGWSYLETNNCGTSLPAGGSCTISVTFKPLGTGTINESLVVTAGGIHYTTTLTGIGSTTSTSSSPVASLSPTSLSFPSQTVGTTSSAQSVTLTNTGNATLNISGISATAPFTDANPCGSSLAPGASCAISVTFTPTTTGTVSGVLSLSDNAAGSPQSVSLTGSGASSSTSTGSSGVITMTPTALNFGTVKKGTSSASQAVTLTNGTSSPAVMYTVWVGWSYTQTNNCGSSLPAGASCTINVTFTPLGTGTINENLAVNAGSTKLTTTLTGSGS